MKVMTISEFGDANVFVESQMPKPELQSGHVIIKVVATSINPLDCKLRQGLMPDLIPEFPAVLQGDVAGTIEAVADDVEEFLPGDEVYGCIGGFLNMSGGLAEHALADSKLIALKPKSLTMREAAALPLVAETAWEALIDYADIQPMKKVLIHGGTGGVGHIAIQLAKWRGAIVYTTVSNQHKADISKQLGADYIINYKEKTVEQYVQEYTDNRGFDIVFDTIGGDNLEKSFQAAAQHGQVISINPGAQHDLSPAFQRGLSIHLVLQPLPLITGQNRQHFGKILQDVAELVDDKKITPLVDTKQFCLTDIAKAHRYLESHQAIGKVIVEIK